MSKEIVYTDFCLVADYLRIVCQLLQKLRSAGNLFMEI